MALVLIIVGGIVLIGVAVALICILTSNKKDD